MEQFIGQKNIKYAAVNTENLGCEEARFRSILLTEGQDAALKFMKENVIRNYRKAVLDKTKYAMYRRTLIESYLSAKKIVQKYS